VTAAGGLFGVLRELRRAFLLALMLAVVATIAYIAAAASAVDNGLLLTVSWQDPALSEIGDAHVDGIDLGFLDDLPDDAGSEFRARWSGVIHLPEGGEYELWLRADDHAEVVIEPGPVLVHALGGEWWSESAPFVLEPGLHRISAEFTQGLGGSVLDLRFGSVGNANRRIPVENLYPPDTDLAAVGRAVRARRLGTVAVWLWAAVGWLGLLAVATGAIGGVSTKGKALGAIAILAYVALLIRWFNDPGLLGEGSMRAHGVAPLVAFLLAAIIAIAVVRRDRWAAMRAEITAAWGMPRAEVVALVAVLVVSFLFQLPTILYPAGLQHGDAAINGLMALHIAEGRVAPAFYYGQQFMGTLFSHLLGLLFVLTGPWVGGMALLTWVFYAGFLVATYLLVRQASVPSVAWVTALWLAIPPSTLLITLAQSEYAQLLLLSSLAWVIVAARLGGVLKDDGWWGIAGFVLGLAFWAYAVAVIALAAVAVSLPFILGRRQLAGAAWRLAAGFLLGLAPGLVGWGTNLPRFVEWFLNVGGRDAGTTLIEVGTRISRDFLGNLLFGADLLVGLPAWAAWSLITVVTFAVGWIVVHGIRYRRQSDRPDDEVGRRRLAAALPLALFVVFQLTLLARQGQLDMPVRYVVPIYLGLPAVVAITLWSFIDSRSRYARHVVVAVMLLWAAIPSSGSIAWLRTLPGNQASLDASLAAMKEARVDACLAPYMDAYRIAYLTLEETVCDSIETVRIPRYLEVIETRTRGRVPALIAAPHRVEMIRGREEELRSWGVELETLETPRFLVVMPSR